MEILASEHIENSFIKYGSYVLTSRAIPHLDGLKPVQRKILYVTSKIAKSQYKKSATIVGEVIGKHNPHGDIATYAALVRLVQNKLIDGQGNFGLRLLEKVPAASMRYTKVRISKIFENIIKYFEVTPKTLSAIGYEEPELIPTPLPFALITGSDGIGVGTTTRIPAFTPISLYEAWKNDNPKLLKPNYEYVTYKEEYERLWKVGKGYIKYSFSVSSNTEDGYKQFIIEGYPVIIKPGLGTIKKLAEEGLVYLRDESTSKMRIVVGRIPRIRSITDNDIKKLVVNAAINSKSYNIMIYNNLEKVVERIGIKRWIDLSMGFFKAIVDNYKTVNIERISNEIEKLKLVTPIAEEIKKTNNLSKIAKKLKVNEDLVNEVLSKSLRYLDKNYLENKIKTLNNELNIYKDISWEEEAYNIIKSYEDNLVIK